ncbi:MAG: hypothetical protein ABJK39_03245 [Hyphomicrobiales bacterium]
MMKITMFKTVGLAVSMAVTGFVATVPANALVVVEQKGDVNIIRNVKTFTAYSKQVRDKRAIGSSTLIKPEQTLSDQELARCNRRARVITIEDSATVVHSGAAYCQ